MNRYCCMAMLFWLSNTILAAEPEKSHETLKAKVVRVTDGDTITLRAGKELVVVKLEGVDAPERGQPFGAQSKEELIKLLGDKEVTLEKTSVDKKKQTFGIISVAGVNINSKMLEEGWAWHSKPNNDDEELAKLETEARQAQRGLWAEKSPMPPWEFRDQKQTEEVAKPAPAARPKFKRTVKPQPKPEEMEGNVDNSIDP